MSFEGVLMLKEGARCQVGRWCVGWWVVIHQPSEMVMWGGPEWVDAIGFATGRKQ